MGGHEADVGTPRRGSCLGSEHDREAAGVVPGRATTKIAGRKQGEATRTAVAEGTPHGASDAWRDEERHGTLVVGDMAGDGR